MKRLMFLTLLCGVAAVYAGPAADAAGEYEVVHLKGTVCKAGYELSTLKVRNGSATPEEAYREFLTCKSGVVRDAKSVYSKVLAKLRTADAKKALKDYQVALMSFLEGIEPKSGETNGQYAQRMAGLDAAIEVAWQRLQLEL